MHKRGTSRSQHLSPGSARAHLVCVIRPWTDGDERENADEEDGPHPEEGEEGANDEQHGQRVAQLPPDGAVIGLVRVQDGGTHSTTAPQAGRWRLIGGRRHGLVLDERPVELHEDVAVHVGPHGRDNALKHVLDPPRHVRVVRDQVLELVFHHVEDPTGGRHGDGVDGALGEGYPLLLRALVELAMMLSRVLVRGHLIRCRCHLGSSTSGHLRPSNRSLRPHHTGVRNVLARSAVHLLLVLGGEPGLGGPGRRLGKGACCA